jgi:hypothetical protein
VTSPSQPMADAGIAPLGRPAASAQLYTALALVPRPRTAAAEPGTHPSPVPPGPSGQLGVARL